MDVFSLRDELVGEYSGYATSFLNIRDRRIKDLVEAELAAGRLWPEPMIQLNPAFESGGTIDALCDDGTLHDECRRIFRVAKEPGPRAGVAGKALQLHRHQADAIRIAAAGRNYVLTTGTGSGKSLSYIVPIVDRVLKLGPGRGIKAIIVYPMNALANSQQGELAKFLEHGYPQGAPPVRVRRYTGQESDEERQEIIADPPDVLLTNYVMLELLLTRVHERELIKAAQGLQFLVLDELHTYRGRQGADVAFLIRRVRQACGAGDLQVVGTSATMAGADSFEEQQREVAAVATDLFGTQVGPGDIVGETLLRSTAAADPADPAYVDALRTRATSSQPPPVDHAGFVADPLARWVEHAFGLDVDAAGRVVRRVPRPIGGPSGAARELAELTGLDDGACAAALRSTLMAGFGVQRPGTPYPVFAFRLHQFLSKGDTVYASLEDEHERHVTLDAQKFVPGDRDKVLLPLVFCRECGQEYFSVARDGDSFLPRPPAQRLVDHGEAGYLYVSSAQPWPRDPAAQVDRLPEDLIDSAGTVSKVKASMRKWVPAPVTVGTDAVATAAGGGVAAAYVRAPFRFCLRCGVAHGVRQSDYAKLSTLSSEGRSTATTILTLSALLRLRGDTDLAPEARKLLSFIDNRQDAALQTGHFNDFVQVGMLRAALWRAADAAGPAGLRHDDLAQRVTDALGLDVADYAADPDVKYMAREEADSALRGVVGYRLYLDQRRGWRVTQPNLEQCGLLRIDYVSLDELCANEADWAGTHPALAGAAPQTRELVARVLLDHMRRELAIKVPYLTREELEKVSLRSDQHLAGPWALDDPRPETGYPLRPRSRTKSDERSEVFLSSRAAYGQFLRRDSTFADFGHKIGLDDSERILRDLLDRLRIAGIVAVVADPAGPGDVPAYMVNAAAMRWVAQDATTSYHDPLRTPQLGAEPAPPNPYFSSFYRDVAATAGGIRAAEHTAQVPSDDRIAREDAFRTGRLPLLFCSPTMELGVDIAQLNVVNLRNVPPSPANYAQRSGRAGRSGQPALVFTYCTTGSPHDQWFFRRPEDMVAGAVTAPRMDLANEDLVRSHVDAIWLRATGESLGKRLLDVLEVDGAAPPQLPLRDTIAIALHDTASRARAEAVAKEVLAGLEATFGESGWWSDTWLADTLASVPTRFEAACDRWRGLYRSATRQRDVQNAIANDVSRPKKEREAAKRLRNEAESQCTLLEGDDGAKGGNTLSDFYTYRYFAAEGFLPGYSFPRLPLSAYIPARRGRFAKDDMVQRPRFLAITEFGPRTFIYHEGARYQVDRVMLPVGDHGGADADLPTETVKLCDTCGYLHRISGDLVDLCEHCGELLPPQMDRLMRLQNVSTRRRDRISSDEEERTRRGFEVRTALRFAEREGAVSKRVADVAAADGTPLVQLAYGQAATLWRINLGWSHRADKAQMGFVLDTERGIWGNDKDLAEVDPDEGDPELSKSLARVVPYVEDTRNCLVVTPDGGVDADKEVIASLQAALDTATQIAFGLESSEVAAECLPDDDGRTMVLLYEAAEGGAGVLRRFVDDTATIGRVAAIALELCHFDPVTGADLGGPAPDRPCEAACYDCLMSYSNQRDHRFLDRHAIRDLLVALRDAHVGISPVAAGRDDHWDRLRRQCQSDLERDWLDLVYSSGRRLPTQAQLLIDAAGVCPDFVYRDGANAPVAVFIDGPHHDAPDRRAADRAQEDALFNLGWDVQRFTYSAKESWDEHIDARPDVYGEAP